MKHNIAFIIVAYHPEMDEFGQLLRVLPASETIVVDNGQTLASGDVGKAMLLSQTKNVGYGAAGNIGIRHAIAQGNEWFVILNQDVTLSRSAVAELTKKICRVDPCVAGPFTGGLDPKRWTTELPSERVDYISGSCIAIHKKVIEKVGYFYEPYFLYYEEVDYCIRASRGGFKIQQVVVSGITHDETRALGKGSIAHQYYLSRNHLLFVERLAPRAVKLHEFFRFGKTISEHIMKKERGAIYGIRDYVFRRFGQYGGII